MRRHSTARATVACNLRAIDRSCGIFFLIVQSPARASFGDHVSMFSLLVHFSTTFQTNMHRILPSFLIDHALEGIPEQRASIARRKRARARTSCASSDCTLVESLRCMRRVSRSG